jgi:hypothetical protein
MTLDGQSIDRARRSKTVHMAAVDWVAWGMAFEVDYAHKLEPSDARIRLRALGEYLTNKHGLSVTWTSEDQARISGKYMIVTIDGTLSLEPGMAKFSGKDPGMLWRGKAREYLQYKLEKYLDPGVAADALPRR